MDYGWFLFGFDGRINRAKYWIGGLAILGAMIFVVISLAVAGGFFGVRAGRYAINVFGFSASLNFGAGDAASRAWFPQIVTIPMTLLFAWVYAAIAIKRLHDRNKSGWWMLAFVVVPSLHDQFGALLGDAAWLSGLVTGILFLWGFIEMAFLSGTEGTNRFGANPLEAQATQPGWDQLSELDIAAYRAGLSPASSRYRR